MLQADGGTRTASVTGGYVALAQACQHLQRIDAVKRWPLTGQVAAISCGIFEGQAVLDLDYDEDSNAEADANFVMTDKGMLVEVQGTAEGAPFSRDQFGELLDLAQSGIADLCEMQRKALGMSS